MKAFPRKIKISCGNLLETYGRAGMFPILLEKISFINFSSSDKASCVTTTDA